MKNSWLQWLPQTVRCDPCGPKVTAHARLAWTQIAMALPHPLPECPTPETCGPPFSPIVTMGLHVPWTCTGWPDAFVNGFSSTGFTAKSKVWHISLGKQVVAAPESMVAQTMVSTSVAKPPRKSRLESESTLPPRGCSLGFGDGNFSSFSDGGFFFTCRPTSLAASQPPFLTLSLSLLLSSSPSPSPSPLASWGSSSLQASHCRLCHGAWSTHSGFRSVPCASLGNLLKLLLRQSFTVLHRALSRCFLLSLLSTMLFLPELQGALGIAVLAVHMLPKASNWHWVRGFATSYALDIGMSMPWRSLGLLVQLLEGHEHSLGCLPVVNHIFHTWWWKFIEWCLIWLNLLRVIQLDLLVVGLPIGIDQDLVQPMLNLWVKLQPVQSVD